MLQLKNGKSIMAFTFLEKNCQLTIGAAGNRGGKRMANEFWGTENTVQIFHVSLVQTIKVSSPPRRAGYPPDI